jgi:tetratricopeptide (TPR) repeat protein
MACVITKEPDKTAFFNIRMDVLICLFLVLATLAVYRQVGDYPFIGFDDSLYVSNNKYVKTGFTFENIKWAFSFTHKDKTYWHPLTWLSHMLDVQLYGMDAGGHHRTNLILHIANSLLLFLVLSRMTKALWRSALVAALFTLHPLNVDSVAWVAERKNVLSTFFWFLTMLSYISYTETPCFRRYLLVFVPFSLGLMAKPMLVTLPFVLLLLDYWPLGRLELGKLGRQSNEKADIFTGFFKQRCSAFRLILEKVPFLILSAVLVYVASVSLQRVGVVITTDIVPMKLRIANALVSYVSYIEKTVWPHNLSVFYPFPNMVPVWQSIGSGLLLAGVSVVTARKRKEMPYLLVGWLWYLGTLVPVLGLIQAGLWPAMADRWAYVPLIGLFVMIVWVIPELVTRWGFGKVGLSIGALAFLSTFTGMTWVQMGYWANSVTLFERALAVTSANYVAHYNLGVSLFSQDKIDEAVDHFREALRINPSFLDARTNLGVVLVNQGRIAEAVKHFNGALRINPRSQTVHNNLGVALARKGRTDAAIKHFRKALEVNPDFDDAHNNLGVVLASQGKFDEAIEHYSEALRINPRFVKVHNNLGSVLIRKGQLEKAIAHFQEALRLRPGYTIARDNLKKVLAARERMNTDFEKNYEKGSQKRVK